MWMEDLSFPTEPMPQPNINPEIGKAGLSNQSDLPIGMRRSPITSAFKTYSPPKRQGIKPHRLDPVLDKVR
jgi:hypothetical protein